jgi:predicted enzyme related to lactoylglutathione lyase
VLGEVSLAAIVQASGEMNGIHFDPITLWVGDFERCLTFYRDVFELEVLRLFRGDDHPPWVEFRMGDTRFCLHGGYGDATRYRTGAPLALHFEVADIETALERIRQHGGTVRRDVVEEDNRPAELRIVRQAIFGDPDGNEFEVVQLVSEFAPGPEH